MEIYEMTTKPKSERFELRIDEEQLSKVDEWSSEQQDQPTRAEAVRRLVNLGLSSGSSRAVHFSDGEKMLILMMGDLFKSLKVKYPESNPDFLSEVIYGGHYWAPKWHMQGVFHDHIDNPKDLDHVCDVLDMWSFIEDAYENLNTEQKATIAEEVGARGTIVKFLGFDGNNESSQMSIARFIVNKINRFPQFKDRDLNSHHQTYEHYRRMLTAFRPMQASLIGGRLNVQQLIVLLKI